MLLDRLKRPIAIGDTVLTKSYGGCSMNTQFVVVKLYKDTIGVELPQRHVDYRTKYTKVSNAKIISRYPSECVVINEQLAYNVATWPEL